MDLLLIIARLTIGVVLAIASVAKMSDRVGSQQALENFGISPILARPLSKLLPFAELFIAVALLPASTAWWGAIGALVLLLFFIAGISINLVKGRKPDCHCFGQLHSAPISWKTLLRNGLLVFLAVFIVWQGGSNPGPGAFDWMASLSNTEIIGLTIAFIALIAAVVEGWFLLHILQQQGRMLLKIDALEAKLTGDGVPQVPNSERTAAGLPIGVLAPNFQLPDLSGTAVTLESLHSIGKPLILLFSDPNCGPCTALMPDVARWQRDYASELTVAIVSRGTIEVNRAKSEEFALSNILLQQEKEISQTYKSYGTPGAVLVQLDGTIGSPLAMGAEEIRNLVEKTVGELVIA